MVVDLRRRPPPSPAPNLLESFLVRPSSTRSSRRSNSRASNGGFGSSLVPSLKLGLSRSNQTFGTARGGNTSRSSTRRAASARSTSRVSFAGLDKEGTARPHGGSVCANIYIFFVER